MIAMFNMYLQDFMVYAGLDETKKKLLFLENELDIDGSIDFRMSLISRFPCILLRTNLTDAHCYIFRQAFLQMLDQKSCFGKRTLYSIREELVPRLVKHQSHAPNSKDGYNCAVRLLESDFCVRVNNLKNYNEANKFVREDLLSSSAMILLL